ncbi:MAG: zeta toxin family protein [Chloroflexota bacterium]
MKTAVEAIIHSIQKQQQQKPPPLLVAIDGGSGSGKSTLAALVAQEIDAVVVPGDDFYAAHTPDAAWDSYTAAERARDCINWRRLRAEALEPLLSGQTARWHPFDFATGPNPDGTYNLASTTIERHPKSVILLDGAYSARPELADLVTLSVLINVPTAERHARLAKREPPDFLATWHRRWDPAEAYYFSQVCPPSSFDLVIENGVTQ